VVELLRQIRRYQHSYDVAQLHSTHAHVMHYIQSSC